jgi:hypothetical protein
MLWSTVASESMNSPLPSSFLLLCLCSAVGSLENYYATSFFLGREAIQVVFVGSGLPSLGFLSYRLGYCSDSIYTQVTRKYSNLCRVIMNEKI